MLLSCLADKGCVHLWDTVWVFTYILKAKRLIYQLPKICRHTMYLKANTKD